MFTLIQVCWRFSHDNVARFIYFMRRKYHVIYQEKQRKIT